jgi:polysaccharide pyruvyl transferase WcaK-like protein
MDSEGDHSGGNKDPGSRVRVAVLGIFGSTNFGNEISLQIFLNLTREKLGAVSHFGICPNPEAFEKIYGAPAAPLYGPAPRLEYQRLLNKAFLNIPRLIANLFAAIRHTRNIDLLAIPGTGFLDDKGLDPLRNTVSFWIWLRCARLRNVPIAIVDVGAGPITGFLNKVILKRVALLADYRSYRDHGSRSYLSQIGIDTTPDKVFPDIAFTLKNDQSFWCSNNSGRKIVGIGLMRYTGRGKSPAHGDRIYSIYISKMAQFVAWLIEKGYDVHTLVGDPASDRRAVVDLMDTLKTMHPQTTIDSRIDCRLAQNYFDLAQQIRCCELVVATRFHNVICALSCGRPTIAVGYAGRFVELMESFGLHGYHQNIETLDVGALKMQFEALEAASSDVQFRLAEQAKQARIQLNELYDDIGRLIAVAISRKAARGKAAA